MPQGAGKVAGAVLGKQAHAAHTGLGQGQRSAARRCRCVVDSTALPWDDSPSPLLKGGLLERNGGEVARATSVVRYALGARFDGHRDDMGEEILVLEGTLSDESGTYGPGTYLKTRRDRPMRRFRKTVARCL
jgi:anti-sigma factor ChrR (cupin superfamily)